MSRLSCFKRYDIRGRVGVDLDAGLMQRIGRACAAIMAPGAAVTGRDIRASSPALQAALIAGLREGGADAIDIGLCGTEEVYFATDHYGAGAGLMVTASHNPADYNGLKLVGPGARPLAPETLRAIHDHAADPPPAPAPRPGDLRHADPRPAYVDRVLSFVDAAALAPLTVLVDAGNGAAGPTFDAIAAALAARGAPLRFVRRHHAPDPGFPNGVPNPLLAENQPGTAAAVRAAGADFGVAWDGDFDRCFLFDETGAFVAGEYVVALLAGAFLADAPGARIVHDPRVIWTVQAAIAAGGGEAVAAPTGHAFVKDAMRRADAIYGGEMSAHHYFRAFMFCDSGMIPWLKIAERLSAEARPLSALIEAMRAAHPSSGEINFRVADPAAALARVTECYAPQARSVDHRDGVSCDMGAWRFNLRASNTEPLLRLNLETRGDPALLAAKRAELSARLAAA